MNENWGTAVEEKPERTPLFSKMWGGSILFALVSAIHLVNGYFINIKNPIISLLVTQGLIVIPALLYMAYWGENPFKFMRFRKFHIGSAFLIPLFMFSLLPIMGLLNAISMLFATNNIGTSVENITGGNVWLGLLLVAMVPAFVEETTFRGAIYHSMRGARPVRAIILSGFIFGAMHMNFNQFVYAAALGIVMGFLLEATGSIVSTMILHFCFNANSVILMSLLPKMMDFLSKVSPEEYSQMTTETTAYTISQLLSTIVIMIPVAVCGTAFAFLFYFLIAKLNKRWEYIKFLFAKSTKPQRDAFEKPAMINIFTVVGFVICLAVCVFSELYSRGIIKL